MTKSSQTSLLSNSAFATLVCFWNSLSSDGRISLRNFESNIGRHGRCMDVFLFVHSSKRNISQPRLDIPVVWCCACFMHLRCPDSLASNCIGFSHPLVYSEYLHLLLVLPVVNIETLSILPCFVHAIIGRWQDLLQELQYKIRVC